MANLRLVHRNDADQATSLSASTTAGSLVAALMQNDRKGGAHRSTGTSVSYTLTWTGGVSIGCVALPATNLGPTATMRVRLYSDTACTTLLQDSGTNFACVGLTSVPWTWTGTYNVNSFAYGIMSKAVTWFAANQAGVKGLIVDLVDTSNPAGYIDCSRIVAGPWWSPEWNAEYGCTMLISDDSTTFRNGAGDLPTDRGPMHSELSITLPLMPEADRSQLAQVMRANGVWKPIFLSLMPAWGTDAEQDHMIFGKRKNSPYDHPSFARYKHPMTIESW